MHVYLVAGMHKYLVRLEVLICVWVSLYRISMMRELQMAWWDCVFAQAPLSIRDYKCSFVLLIGMFFKYMCFNLPRFYNSLKSK